MARLRALGAGHPATSQSRWQWTVIKPWIDPPALTRPLISLPTEPRPAVHCWPGSPRTAASAAAAGAPACWGSVRRAAPLAEHECVRVFEVLDLSSRSIPRLSPAVPSMVSSTIANALISSNRSRRSGSAMRISAIPIPNRRSLVSRKLGSNTIQVYARSCAGLDHAMSEGSSYPVWETLPGERQHGLVRTLGQMAMRQIRAPSSAQQALGETVDDDGGGSHAAAAGPPVRENLSATS
jgi:hypothetical protein